MILTIYTLLLVAFQVGDFIIYYHSLKLNSLFNKEESFNDKLLLVFIKLTPYMLIAMGFINYWLDKFYEVIK